MFLVRQSTYDRVDALCAHYFDAWMDAEQDLRTARRLLRQLGDELTETNRQLQQLQRNYPQPEALRPDDV